MDVGGRYPEFRLRRNVEVTMGGCVNCGLDDYHPIQHSFLWNLEL